MFYICHNDLNLYSLQAKICDSVGGGEGVMEGVYTFLSELHTKKDSYSNFWLQTQTGNIEIRTTFNSPSNEH